MSPKIKNTILWLRVYNGCSAFLYFILGIAFCVAITIIAFSNEESETPILVNLLCVGFLTIFMFVFFVISLIGALKAGVRQKKIWVLQIILVALGLSSFPTMIPCIFLLVSLLSDEVQKYYKESKR